MVADLQSGLTACAAERDALKAAARDLMREIIYDHPAASGFTILVNHEPLYKLAVMVDGNCITKEGAERSAEREAQSKEDE